MKRIELFAPMGAGKSFLFNALMKKKLGYGFVNARDEVYNILLDQIKKKSAIHYYLLKIVFYSPLKRRVFSNYDFYQYLKNEDEINTFLENMLVSLSGKGDNAKTLIRINALLKDLTDVSVLNSYSKKNLILHEESLLQRGLGFEAGSSFINSYDYFDHVKLPDAAIFIDTPFDILKSRVLQRENSKISFFVKRAHSVEELKKVFDSYKRICSKLEAKGVKTLKLSGINPIQKNLEIIDGWIKKV